MSDISVSTLYMCSSADCTFLFFFCFKQKTAYDMRISDWSSDVCSSDLVGGRDRDVGLHPAAFPILAGHRVIGPPDRDEGPKASAQFLTAPEMIGAAGRAAHQHAAVRVLHRQREMLGRRSGPARRQHIDFRVAQIGRAHV